MIAYQKGMVQGFLGAVIAILILAACSTLVAPKTTDQTILYGYATVTGVLNSATGLLDSGAITKEDAVQVQTLAGQARGLLDSAKASFLANDLPTAQARLQLASQILTNLQAYLNTKGGGK